MPIEILSSGLDEDTVERLAGDVVACLADRYGKPTLAADQAMRQVA